MLTWTFTPAKAFWAGLLLMVVAFPASGLALDVHWGLHPRKERLVFHFQNPVPKVDLKRTGPQQLTLTLPPGIWSREAEPPQPDLSNSRRFRLLRRADNVVEITTASPAFGFLHFTLPEQNKLVIDVFRDELGTQWSAADTERDSAPAAEDTKSPDRKPAPPSGKAAEAGPQQAGASPPARGEETRTAPGPSSGQGQRMADATDQPVRPEPAGEPKPASVRAENPPAQVFRAAVAWHNKAGPSNEEPKAEPLLTSEQIPEQGSLTGSGPAPPPKTSRHTITRPVTTTDVKAVQPRPEPGTEPAREVPARNATKDAGRPGGGNQSGQARNGTDLTRSISAMMAEGRAALANGKWQAAKTIFAQLLSDPRTSQARRKDILHHLADATFSLYQNSPDKHFSQITSTLEEAINADPESPETALALLRLFRLNLKVGNLPEARGYFNVLKRSFPQSRHVPTGHLYWGDHYLEQQEYRPAARHYRAIVENSPECSAALPATAGLIKTLKDLEFYDQAWTMVEYLRNRWPEHPLKNPDLLRLSGLVAKETGRNDEARDLLWRYCNLKPRSIQEDLILTRIGDIYLQMGKTQDARKMYQKVVSRYPDQQGGLIAKMRLAEESVNDKPSFTTMVSVFNRPYNLRPVKVYREITRDHPDSPLAPLAQLKLAMWHVWDTNYDQALKAVTAFEHGYADSQLLSRARDVGQKALKPLIMEAVKASSYDRALELWDNHPFLHEGSAPETRIAVALSLWKAGSFEQALTMAEPYLERTDLSSASESAVELVLNIHLANSSWKDILGVTETLEPGELSPALRSQLVYARALAHQHLMQDDKARPLWREVVNMDHVSNLQQGFAFYFLAEQAMQDNDWENVYILAQKAFRELQASDRAKAKALDSLDMLVEVTRRSGRSLEALEWAHRYGDLLPPDSPDWPAAQYKLANLYRQNGFLAKWEKNLQELKSRFPQSLYGEMAASDLSEQRLQEQAQAFFDQ